MILQKSRKAFTYADFRHFTKTQKCVVFEFDHSLSHFHAKSEKKLNKNRDVAQLGARDIWDVEAAGSNPVTPTKFADSSACESRKVRILCGF